MPAGARTVDVHAVDVDQACRLLLEAPRHLQEGVVLHPRRAEGERPGALPSRAGTCLHETLRIHGPRHFVRHGVRESPDCRDG